MKKLRLRTLWSIQKGLERGRLVNFKSGANVVAGINQSGKTTIINTILYAFGARPFGKGAEFPQGLVTLLEFDVDGSLFYILHSMLGVHVFDGEKRLYRFGTRSSMSWMVSMLGVGEFFDCYGFGYGKRMNFIFSPFYISQDRGWGSVWGSLLDSSIKYEVKKDFAALFQGKVDGGYFTMRERLEFLKITKNDVERRIKIYKEMYQDASRDVKNFELGVDVDKFRDQIAESLKNYQAAYAKQAEYRLSLSELQRQKSDMAARIGSLSGELEDLKHDYRYAIDRDGRAIICPLCKTEHENSFSNFLSMSVDVDRLESEKAVLQSKLENVSKKIAEITSHGVESVVACEDVRRYLASSIGGVAFDDVVNASGRRHSATTCLNKLESSVAEYRDIRAKISIIESDILEKRKEGRRIDRDVEREIDGIFTLLGISASGGAYDLEKFIVRATGSARPRAVLGFMAAIVKVSSSNDGKYMLPFIVDAPLQQSQDDSNYIRMLRFIVEEMSCSTQIVVALNSDSIEKIGVEPVCVVNGHESAFVKEDYLACKAVVDEFLIKAMPLFS